MKKMIALFLLALMLCTLFAGCGKSDSADAPDSAAEEAAQSEDTPADTGNTSISGKATSYAEAYTQLAAINEAVVALMTELNEKHNAGLEDGDANRTDLLMYPMMLMSLDLAFTAAFDEKPESLEGVRMAFGMLGSEDAQVQHPAPNQYGITFTDNEGASWVYEAVFDPATGSLRMVEHKDGTPFSFYEFVNLGGDNYAFETGNERAVVNYKDGTVNSFAYSAKNAEEGKYDSGSDSIYPSGNGANANWVFADGEDSYPQAYTFDGATLKMQGDPMFGERVSVEIQK